MKILKLFPKSYTFNDLALIPRYNPIESRTHVNLESYLTKKTKIKIPLVAANMDTVIDDNLADLLIKNGTYPIFHRFTSLDKITNWAKKYNNNCYLSCGYDYDKIIGLAEKYNCRGICVDIAHGHSKTMLKVIKNIPRSLEIIAGNVCTPEACFDLIKADVDAIKIGIGPGAACITRIMTGFGLPQMSAILECAELCKKYNMPLIADGGIELPKHVVLALAGGASSVMIGKLFAQCNESASPKIIENGEVYIKYRGQASLDFQNENRGGLKKGTVEEGVSMKIKSSGSGQLLIDKLCGGLKSGCTYAGAKNIIELQKNAIFREVSGNYEYESNFRN